MHAIVFVPPAEEWIGRGQLPGLEVYTNPESFGPGDVVWLVTRMPGDRQTPALCGRLVIAEADGRGEAPATGADAPEPRVNADRGLSERCQPIPCDVIRSWPAWRDQFEGPAKLTATQARCLQGFWAGSVGRRLPR